MNINERAEEIAQQLYDDARNGKLSVINIDTIREALRPYNRSLNEVDRERLEERTVRRVVEMVG